MMALEGLFRKLAAATGRDCGSILRRMVALRVPRGVKDDPAMDAQWFKYLRASATAMEPYSTRSSWTSVPWCLTRSTTPHPAGDPVVPRRTGCLSSFDNAAALECPLAAVSSTLRGVNIVRAFITVGPGGVGQSLNSCLIANFFGGSHGFVNVNVFYTEEEFSKAGRHLHGQGKHPGSHIFTTSDRKTISVLFFFGRIGPTV